MDLWHIFMLGVVHEQIQSPTLAPAHEPFRRKIAHSLADGSSLPPLLLGNGANSSLPQFCATSGRIRP